MPQTPAVNFCLRGFSDDPALFIDDIHEFIGHEQCSISCFPSWGGSGGDRPLLIIETPPRFTMKNLYVRGILALRSKELRTPFKPMNIEILNPIPVQVDLRSVKKSAHVPEKEEKRLLAMIAAAHSAMAAKAIYRISYIDSRGEDSIVIEGVQFRSKVLRKHLDKVERVFPYVVTLGTGVRDLEEASGDVLEKYYLDQIGDAAVVQAREHLKNTLAKRYEHYQRKAKHFDDSRRNPSLSKSFNRLSK